MLDEIYKTKKKLLLRQENKGQTEDFSQESEILKKVKDLEEKVENLNKEIKEQKAKTEKYQKMIN